MTNQLNLDGTMGDPMTVAARAWAARLDLPTWEEHATECKSCDADSGGAIIEIATVPGKASPICWECLPVPGSPLANWEYWSAADVHVRDRCVRCCLKIEGGSFIRGGPICWSCGSPDKSTEEAWLLALRDDVNAPVPWARDHVDGGRVKMVSAVVDALTALEDFCKNDGYRIPRAGADIRTMRSCAEDLLTAARQLTKAAR